jgi:hypothetical protein
LASQTHVNELLVAEVQELVELDTSVLVLLERSGCFLSCGFLASCVLVRLVVSICIARLFRRIKAKQCEQVRVVMSVLLLSLFKTVTFHPCLIAPASLRLRPQNSLSMTDPHQAHSPALLCERIQTHHFAVWEKPERRVLSDAMELK